MRQASTAMSCVALAKAVSSAKAPITPSPADTPTDAMPIRPATTSNCDSSIHPRRRPRPQQRHVQPVHQRRPVHLEGIGKAHPRDEADRLQAGASSRSQ
jgi:hypothetical protein